MDKKIFHRQLIAEIKKIAPKEFYKVTNAGIALKDATGKTEGGFYFGYLQRGSEMTSIMFFNDKELASFIDEISPKYAVCALNHVSIDLWDANPKPSMSANVSGHVFVPTTEKRAEELIPQICNYTQTEVFPWFDLLRNMNIGLIPRIVEYIKKNPDDGFSYPFYLCLYVAKKNDIDFNTFTGMVQSAKFTRDVRGKQCVGISRDFDGDMEIARSLLKST